MKLPVIIIGAGLLVLIAIPKIEAVMDAAETGADAYTVIEDSAPAYPAEGQNGGEESDDDSGGEEALASLYIRAPSVPLPSAHALVQEYLTCFGARGGRGAIARALQRGGRYREMIEGILAEYGLPRELVFLPVIESFYDENTLSPAGAYGLWQLMPERADALGLTIDPWIDERKDPEKSTRAAARYLRELYALFGDWHLALAAYNRGEYGLLRDMKRSGARTFWELVERKAIPRETERFVPQFIACTLIALEPERFGIAVNTASPLRFDRVAVIGAVDLKIAARCVNASLVELRRLNPSLKAWCTPNQRQEFVLNLPPGTKHLFVRNIARVGDRNPFMGCIKYCAGKTETLEDIARKFCTSVQAIRHLNRSRETGDGFLSRTLLIRPGKEFFERKEDL